ncbi:energy transduction protein TonB [Campylobacter sp. RM5004]|uniref:energy transducer TonB n=1 Tax=Campylobacter sp. RM5004 TaxID=1660078 RepID=UPI001EFAAA2A|nr:energy transducer TonB [Campylobacter sp. RM5004]ULO02367.1 energy transduction protein TonB [Campylobacter sp. RM5004]
MRIIVISVLIFLAQVFAVSIIHVKDESKLKNQTSISLSASNFSFIQEIIEEKVEEIKAETKQEIKEGIKKKIKPKEELKKQSEIKKVKQVIKHEEKQVAKQEVRQEINQNYGANIEGKTNANSLNNNSSTGSNDEALALLINELLNKYKKYPKRAKMLNIKGKVAGNFMIKNDELTINIIESSHEMFEKQTKQTIRKVKNKIPKQAYNTRISFVINYK